jgi:hypothetical protein
MKAPIAALLAILGGCIAPPLVGPPTGGGVIFGPEAEEFIRRAGVAQVGVFHYGVGCGVWIADNRLLSVSHVLTREDMYIQVDYERTDSERVAAGDPDDIGQGWVLMQTHLVDPPPSCEFTPTYSVTPGQEALLVGYWPVNTVELRRPAVISGTVVGTPKVFAHAVSNLLCCDFGPKGDEYDGLSGAAVLVKDPADEEWRLAGVFKGHVESSRGEVLSIVVRLPQGIPNVGDGRPPNEM